VQSLSIDPATQPRGAADTAGAARGLGAIHPAKRVGLRATTHCATFRPSRLPNAPRAPRVGRTRIAWHLPLLGVLYPSHACQRRS